jgi:hypothetical protein
MAKRRDNLPKVFRRLACVDCEAEFQATGPAAKRCASCSYEHKLAYERARDIASRPRATVCQRCSAALAGHKRNTKKYCEPCAAVVRKEQVAAFNRSDRDRRNAYTKKSYYKHREKSLAKRKTPEWRKENAGRIKRRRKQNPGYRLHCNISRAVSLSLNGDKGGRRWESLVGYTRAELVAHLERQFTKGMTWGNMGGDDGWQVDHIIPRASFTFSSADDPEFKACWALTNLQPLWRVDNLAKREKRLHLI